MTDRLRSLIAAVVLVSGTTASVQAAQVDPGTVFTGAWMVNSDLMANAGMSAFMDTGQVAAGQDGSIANVVVDGATATPLWDAQWLWMANADPFVTNNFTITNLSGSTQTFVITSTIGIVPTGPATLTSGSVGGSLTDNNTDGTVATIQAVTGKSIYSALIDGVVYQTLLDDPFSTSASGLGATTVWGGASFGLPPNSQPGPAANTNIGIRMEFTLTPGDSVAFTSRFEIEAVPVPAAVWLFGSGVLGLVGVARRRNAA